MATDLDIFFVPVLDKFLVYRPLQPLVALVNRQAIQQLRSGLMNDGAVVGRQIETLAARLRAPASPRPQTRTGPLNKPLFLGIIPTRGCNMGCRYCDFGAPDQPETKMDLNLARAAANAYLKLLHENEQTRGEIHFFGGEPFFAPEVVHFVVEYALVRAAELGLVVHFEATTNGLYGRTHCQWIADRFDTIVLSLDGPADIQNWQRPGRNGRSTFDIVARNARILSAGSVELVIRVCVTAETARRMPEIAHWISQEFRPSTVCFESLTPSPLAEAAGIVPPNPFVFARNFMTAVSHLEAHGIQAILSTADLSATGVTSCPVGQDALIVSPDGLIDACYLLEDAWRQQGLDMRLGRVNVPAEQFEIKPGALSRARWLNLYNKPLCANCFCRYHCAGGCHVNHRTNAPPGHFDGLCLQTRLVTCATLLRQLGQTDLLANWFDDQAALSTVGWHQNDRLVQEEVRG